MAKKVVWIVNQYNGPYNSVRTRQTVLSQHLEAAGYKVYLVCGSSDYKGGPNYFTDKSDYCEVEADGASFIVIRTSDFRRSYERVLVSLQFQQRLWKLRNKFEKPDVIVSDFAGLFGNIFLKWQKKYSIKIIFDILDFWPEGFVDLGYIKRNSLIAKILYGMEHKSYKEADGLIFSVQGGKDYIVDKGWSKETGGDVDTSNIGYLNNGVDLITVDSQKETFVYEDEDLLFEGFKVIYLGSISEFNGLDILIEAARIIQHRGNNHIKFLVYGYGNQEERLKELANKYELTNLVFKGQIDKKYAMNVLSRGDLNVFTFKDTPLLKYGTSPNKLFMYFASGKPVLSMIKPSYDLVECEKCGISVDNEPELVADAVVRFSTMPKAEYDEYCANSRRIAEDYDYKKLVNVLIEKIEN